MIHEELHNIETLLYKDKKIQEAKIILEGIIHSEQPDPRLLSLYAACYKLSEDYQNAIHFYKSALQAFDVSQPEVKCEVMSIYNELSACYKKLGNYSEAIKFFHRTIKLDFNCTEFPSHAVSESYLCDSTKDYFFRLSELIQLYRLHKKPEQVKILKRYYSKIDKFC